MLVMWYLDEKWIKHNEASDSSLAFRMCMDSSE